MNISKSSLHTNNTNNVQILQHLIELNKLPLQIKDTFTFLGIKINPQKQHNLTHINHRKLKAVILFNQLYHKGLKNTRVGHQACVKILDTTIVPKLIYGMEILNLTDTEMKN